MMPLGPPEYKSEALAPEPVLSVCSHFELNQMLVCGIPAILELCADENVMNLCSLIL
jgi:hypothetical protein